MGTLLNWLTFFGTLALWAGLVVLWRIGMRRWIADREQSTRKGDRP